MHQILLMDSNSSKQRPGAIFLFLLVFVLCNNLMAQNEAKTLLNWEVKAMFGMDPGFQIKDYNHWKGSEKFPDDGFTWKSIFWKVRKPGLLVRQA